MVLFRLSIQNLTDYCEKKSKNTYTGITKISKSDTKYKYQTYFHQDKNRKKKIQQSLNVQYSPPKVSIHLQIQNVTSFGNGVPANVCAGVKGVTVEVI